MSDRNRGFSLFELLVALALAGLGVYLLAIVFLPTLRATRRAGERIDLQQSGSVALEKLILDLGRTPTGAFMRPTRVSGGLLLGLHPVTGVSAEARPTYSEQLIIYSWGADHSLRRVLWPREGGLTPARPTLLDPAALARACEEGEGRVLCTELWEFEVAPLGNPVNVRMLLKRAAREGEPEQTVELARDLLMRN